MPPFHFIIIVTFDMTKAHRTLVSLLIPVLAGYVLYSNGAGGCRYVFIGVLCMTMLPFMAFSAEIKMQC